MRSVRILVEVWITFLACGGMGFLLINLFEKWGLSQERAFLLALVLIFVGSWTYWTLAKRPLED